MPISFANVCLSILFIFTLLLDAVGQDFKPDFSTQRSFACLVIDAQSMEPLSKATLHVGRYGWSSDESGHVEAMANIGDTLVFTHVGYLPAILEVKKSFFAQNIVAVKMSPDTIMLSEVVVMPRRVSLMEEVKSITEVQRVQEAVARENFVDSKYTALSAPTVMPTWDAYDNQRQLIANHVSKMENAGLVTGGNEIFSSSRIMNFILLAKRRRPYNVSRQRYSIKPLSSDEESLLMGKSNSN